MDENKFKQHNHLGHPFRLIESLFLHHKNLKKTNKKYEINKWSNKFLVRIPN